MSARNVDLEFDNLKSDFGKLSSDLVNLTDAVRALAGQDAKDYLEKARTVAGQANEDIEATASALSACGSRSIASVEQHIRDRPLVSILIGLGAGLIIGKLITHR